MSSLGESGRDSEASDRASTKICEEEVEVWPYSRSESPRPLRAVLKLKEENERVSADIVGACNPGARSAGGDMGVPVLNWSPKPGAGPGDESGEENN